MALRIAVGGELENSRGCYGNADTMGDDRVITNVALVLIARVLTADGVGETVAFSVLVDGILRKVVLRSRTYTDEHRRFQILLLPMLQQAAFGFVLHDHRHP